MFPTLPRSENKKLHEQKHRHGAIESDTGDTKTENGAALKLSK